MYRSRPLPRFVPLAVAAVMTAVFVAAPTGPRARATAGHLTSAAAAAKATVPRLTITTIASGLDHPWDVTRVPGSTALLFTERDRRSITYIDTSGRSHNLALSPRPNYNSLETGLMSILPAHNFKKTGHFFTCQGAIVSGGHDVRVVMWKLAANRRSATKVRTIVTGLPSSTGRHGGCRLRFGKAALYIGTGDAIEGTNPQSLTSGGGKVLRVVPATGKPWSNNPFVHSTDKMKRLVYTYGHRNVQGLALRPSGQMWSVEQGTYRDDEVNLLHKGGNYGYNPVPGYNESVPMTDHSLPGRQVSAKWSSGDPTLATSGGIWLEGARWGAWNDTLAVGVLKDTRLLVLKFTKSGRFVRSWTPAQLDGTYGRLRSPEIASDGSLLITTDNGNNDRILRIVPHLS
jgi:glucose/arabinose dehydrogenase